MHHNKLLMHSFFFLACFGYWSYTTHFRVGPNFCFRHQYLCSVQGEAWADCLLPAGLRRNSGFGWPTPALESQPDSTIQRHSIFLARRQSGHLKSCITGDFSEANVKCQVNRAKSSSNSLCSMDKPHCPGLPSPNLCLVSIVASKKKKCLKDLKWIFIDNC